MNGYVDPAEIREHLALVASEGERTGDPPKPLFRPYAWRPSRDIPRRQWLYGGHYIRSFTSATFAPGGVGKSMLELVDAVVMASGKALTGVEPAERLRVGYWNGEDPLEETERRIGAIMLHYGLKQEDLEGWFFWGSGRESDLIIAEQTRDGTTILRPNINRVREAVLDLKLDVVQMDPFISTHRVTENDNNAIDVVAKAWGGIANDTNVALDLVHHTTKAAIGRETRVEDGRGGGALLYAVRSARVLNTMSPEEAAAAGIEPKRRRYYFRVDNGKANLAPPPDGSTWYRFMGVDLGNGENILKPGDNIGVPIPWEWPSNAVVTAAGSNPKSMSAAGQRVIAALARLFDQERTFPAPNVPGVPPGTRVVSLRELRDMALELGLFPEPKPDRNDAAGVERWRTGARNAWKRAIDSLQKAKVLRVESEFAWELHKNDHQRVTSRNDD